MNRLPTSAAVADGVPEAHAPGTDVSELRAVFIIDAAAGRNGVGTYYPDLLQHLASRLGAVTLLSPEFEQPRPHQWFSLPLPGDATQRLFLPRPRTLLRRLHALQPDVIVAATPGPYGALALRYANKHRVPACVGYQTYYERLLQLYWPKVFSVPFGLGVRWFQRRCFRAGSVVVTISERMAARARRLGGAEVRIVGTPVGHEFIDKPVAPIASEIGKVLFLGRLAQEKNLEAFLQAAEAMPGLEFHIVGDGPQRDMVERDAERLPNLKYRGWKSRREVVDILDEVQMLVLPSHEEAFGTVVVEAMARARLVLTSAHCGVVKWPRLGDCVFTIDEKESLETAIQKVCALPEIHRARTAALGRELARELNDATLSTWAELLGELASRKNA